MDARQDLVVDGRMMNEGDGWAGSGANPWHLDDSTESTLFLTDESDQPARIGFSVTANGVHYYLTSLKLAPHETRAINLRQIRDAQKADFKNNMIPASATDGAVNWIRLDNVAVSGRLVVINRGGGLSSDYDCNVCPCPATYSNLTVAPSSSNLHPSSTINCTCTVWYTDCNNNIIACEVTISAAWVSTNSSVATVSGGGVVTGQSGGSTSINASYTNDIWYYDSQARSCNSIPIQRVGSDKVTVPIPVNFTQTSGYDAGGGVLHFDYSWQSNTGNLADIHYCTVNEIVTYPGTANPYYWPSPPWSNGPPNPTILPNPPIAGDIGLATDDHTHGDFLKPYASKQFTAVQTYNYTCSTAKGTLYGPLNLVRSVSQNTNGSFKYTITKSGVTASLNPLP